jgi:GDP-L-fucose synthase
MNLAVSSQRQRVLVTGGGGVLGRAVVKALENEGSVAFVAPSRSECDFNSWEQTSAFFREFGPDVVIHLAARVSGVQGNMSFSGEAYRDNATINMNVIEASRLLGVRKIIAAGTVAIYPTKPGQSLSEEDIWAGPPHGSEAAYAHAKLGMLAQLQAYRQQWGMEYAFLVFTNLFGPHDRFDEQYGHVVPSLISRFHRLTRENASEIVVWGDGTPTRDFLFSADAADAVLRCMTDVDGPVNVASGQSLPIRDMVEALREISGFRGNIIWDTSKPNGQMMRAYNVDRMFASGWRPKYSLTEGLRATYAWYNGNLDEIRR